MLLYWFGGPAAVTSFRDNSDGGSDSEAEIELTVGSVSAAVELSRLRDLDSCCVIEGSRFTLTVGIDRTTEYTLHEPSGELARSGPVPVLPPAQPTREDQFRAQFVDFDRVVSGQTTQLATFDDGVSTVRIIEECRTVASPTLPRPWEPLSRRSSADTSVRVAVTGATGLIGSNVVETFLRAQAGCEVVGVARSLPKMARLSHLDPARLRLVHADSRDREGLIVVVRGLRCRRSHVVQLHWQRPGALVDQCRRYSRRPRRRPGIGHTEVHSCQLHGGVRRRRRAHRRRAERAAADKSR